MFANSFGAEYHWIDCTTDSLITGETDQEFSPTENGMYAVVVTKDGCSYTSMCINYDYLSVSKVSDNGRVKVYPNPTSGTVKIVFPKEVEEGLIMVTNDLGQL